MTVETIIDLLVRTMWIGVQAFGPPLAIALVVGLLVGIVQTATQVNEASLGFLPKLVVVGGTLIVLGPWILERLRDHTRELIMMLPSVTP